MVAFTYFYFNMELNILIGIWEFEFVFLRWNWIGICNLCVTGIDIVSLTPCQVFNCLQCIIMQHTENKLLLYIGPKPLNRHLP